MQFQIKILSGIQIHSFLGKMFLFSTTFLTLPLLFLLLNLLQLHWSIYPSWKRPGLFMTFRTLVEHWFASLHLRYVSPPFSVISQWFLNSLSSGGFSQWGSEGGQGVVHMFLPWFLHCKQAEFLNERLWSSGEVVIFLYCCIV